MMQAKYAGRLQWADADGNVFNPKEIAIAIGYNIENVGMLPVPDGTAAGTEIDLPFTGVTGGASMLLVENKTGQELNTAWGGNWAPHIAVGGILLYASPAPPVAGQISSWRFMLTQQQVGMGYIAFAVLGN